VSDRKFEILGKENLLNFYIFKASAVDFRYQRFDGSTAEPLPHFVLDRGESVGILLHDIPANEIVLVEQFRIACAENGPGWMLELPAGRIDANESPEDAARRETLEETGTEPNDINLISNFYLSPGGISERLHLFYCPFIDGISVGEHGGLEHESEDIRIHRFSLDKAYTMIESGEIIDAKTIIALYWLKIRAR